MLLLLLLIQRRKNSLLDLYIVKKLPLSDSVYNQSNIEGSVLDGQGLGEENERGNRTTSAQVYGEFRRQEINGRGISQNDSSIDVLEANFRRRLGKDLRWAPEDYAEPEVDSVTEKTQRLLAEYGVNSYSISGKEWGNKYNPKKDAYTLNGEVYMRDDLSPVIKIGDVVIEVGSNARANSYAIHEGSHLMRQVKNSEYIGFLKRFAGMLNAENLELAEKLGNIAKEYDADMSIFGKMREIDPLTKKEADKVLRAYDELNARIYGTRALDEGLADVYLSQFFVDNATYQEYLSQ